MGFNIKNPIKLHLFDKKRKHKISPFIHSPTYDNYMYAYNNLLDSMEDDISYIFSLPSHYELMEVVLYRKNIHL